MPIHAYIQARMSSSRFPGKVLAPLAGRPVITHVINRVAAVVPRNRITVTTSTDASDDPLAAYVREIGVSVFRGSLDNVVLRFQMCLKEFACDWFFRVCGDSPLLDSTLLQTALTYTHRTDVDLVTNIYPRTFPKGQSVELLRSATFGAIDPTRLTPEEKEHVTKVYYAHPTEFKIINIKSAQPVLEGTSLCIDSFEDLCRLEKNNLFA